MKSFAMVDTLDREQWNEFVCDHPKGSILHTPEMFDVFAKTHHYSPLFLAATSPQGEILALLLAVRIQTLPDPFGALASRSIHYSEPLCQDTEQGKEALAALLAEHDSLMRNRVLLSEVRPLYPAGVERHVLERSEYTYAEYLNYVVNLDQSPQDLWKALTPDCRRRINNCAKEGLQIQQVTNRQGVNILYEFLRLAYTRARVPLADKSLFAQAVKILKSHDRVRISCAYYEGRPVGATIRLLFRERYFAWHAGADRIHPLSPAGCMVWNDFEWAHAHGFSLYDFGGAGWPNKPYGVRDFKAKFGRDLVQYGRYRKVYSSSKLALAEKGYALLRRASNPTHWTSSSKTILRRRHTQPFHSTLPSAPLRGS